MALYHPLLSLSLLSRAYNICVFAIYEIKIREHYLFFIFYES